jgi:large subunit ribosomal protein L18
MSVRDATMRAALAASTAARSPHALRVHFSNRYVYAQIVRASDGHVVASASTIERGFDASTGTIGRPRGGWGPGHGFGGEAAKAAADAGSHAADARRVSRSDKRAAAYVGKTLAERAKQAEVERVRWNRPYGQRYHGKVRAVLEELVGGGIDVVGGKASKA